MNRGGCRAQEKQSRLCSKAWKRAGIRSEGRAVGENTGSTLLAGPTRAREPERVWEWPVGYGLAAEICPRARPLAAAVSGVHTRRKVSRKSPYHTHRHEPINLLNQALRLIVAAVARLVTAEISDKAGESLRLRQSHGGRASGGAKCISRAADLPLPWPDAEAWHHQLVSGRQSRGSEPKSLQSKNGRPAEVFSAPKWHGLFGRLLCGSPG